MKNETILEHWSNEELIGINSLQKNNGEIIILNSCKVISTDYVSYYSSPLCLTTIESLEKFNSDIWTTFEVFSNRLEINNEYIVFGGEGGMGNEGFIACTDKFDNFLWALFFTDSNPFYKIEFGNNEIHAYS
jgi:hypothetical protein